MMVWMKRRQWAAGMIAVILSLVMLGQACCAYAGETVLYTAKMYRNARLLEKKDEDSSVYTRIPKGTKINILAFDPYYVTVSYKNYIGYMKRDHITEVEAVDPVSTPPYGVEINRYIAVIDQEAPVLSAPQADSETLITLFDGARVSMIDITDGWARLIYHRQYAYIHASHLKDLRPVCLDVTQASDETPIAAFTSFYKITTNTENLGRMINIAVACTRMSHAYAVGEEMNFNRDIGPYTSYVGYQPAPVLVDGTTKINYGGGTCQVSSTLYNVVLQLPGITVLQRRPHGPAAASYLPHGVDAAVGNDSLNFRIRNDYPFPVRIDASSQDGALYVSIYRADESSLAESSN